MSDEWLLFRSFIYLYLGYVQICSYVVSLQIRLSCFFADSSTLFLCRFVYAVSLQIRLCCFFADSSTLFLCKFVYVVSLQIRLRCFFADSTTLFLCRFVMLLFLINVVLLMSTFAQLS